MATEVGVVEKTSEINDDLETTESDTELQNIFVKLRVNHRSKKTPGQLTRKLRTSNLRRRKSGHLPLKHKPRKLIKDATFIFTSNKTKNRTESSVNRLKGSLSQKEPQRTDLSTPRGTRGHRVQGCGEQFRNSANVKVTNTLNMDDTTPEELAAYFDQLLHIPKPMSQMAEMMYT